MTAKGGGAGVRAAGGYWLKEMQLDWRSDRRMRKSCYCGSSFMGQARQIQQGVRYTAGSQEDHINTMHPMC